MNPATTPQPRVFVPEDCPRFNFKPAAQFGQVQFLIRGDFSGLNLTDMASALQGALRSAKFDPAVDYVCLSGNVNMVAVLMAVASQWSAEVRVLVFDAGASRYRERSYRQPPVLRGAGRVDPADYATGEPGFGN